MSDITIDVSMITDYEFDENVPVSLRRIVNQLNNALTVVAKRKLANQLGVPVFHAKADLCHSTFEILLGEVVLFTDNDFYGGCAHQEIITGKQETMTHFAEQKIIQICLQRLQERIDGWRHVLTISKIQKMMKEPNYILKKES